MKKELLEQLRRITAEEQELLQGKSAIEKERYTNTKDFTIDGKRLLEKGKLIDIRTHTRFVPFPKHKHDYIELIYMCEGSIVHWINDTNRVVLEAGDMLFLNQHAFHSIEPAGERDIAINFIVRPEFFDVAFSMMEGESELRNFIVSSLRKDTGKSDYLHFKVADALPVQNLVENMIWSLLEGQVSMRKINQTTMGLLFLNLMNYTDKIESAGAEQKESVLVMAMLRYAEEHYKTASLTEFSGTCGESVYHLSRLIKQNTGYTFKEILQMKRFHKALQLLTETSLSVSDVIAAVGYENTSYFYRMFREKYGVSPREYRIQEIP